MGEKMEKMETGPLLPVLVVVGMALQETLLLAMMMLVLTKRRKWHRSRACNSCKYLFSVATASQPQAYQPVSVPSPLCTHYCCTIICSAVYRSSKSWERKLALRQETSGSKTPVSTQFPRRSYGMKTAWKSSLQMIQARNHRYVCWI